MVDQSCSTPIATNPIPDFSTIAFAVEGPAYSSETETHVAYRPQSLYLVGMTPPTAPPPSTWRTSAPTSASAASSARS